MLHAGNLGPICAAQQGLLAPPSWPPVPLERTRVASRAAAHKKRHAPSSPNPSSYAHECKD